MSTYRKSSILLAATLAAASACDTGRLAAPGNQVEPLRVSRSVVIPAKGTATTLDFATYNIEWFGDPVNGPTNEALQQSNVRDVVGGADMDIWGFEEVVSNAAFDNMKAQLPGYSGFVANETLVVNGPAYYSDFGNTEQKVAILYKSSMATLLGAKIILTGSDYDFAGRPPMEVSLRVNLNGAIQDIVVIVLHMKCCTDLTSYTRRQNASIALKNYLDTTYPTQKVWVIGDWNDDVDTSIMVGSPSPYQNFVNASTTYRFETKVLSDAHIASTVYYPDMIDHHLVTNEGDATYVTGSAEVYRVDSYIANYGTTTTDHYPVLSRYSFGPVGNIPPTASYTYSCSNLACTFTDASTDADGTITAWNWNFGDASTSTVRSPSHTFAAAGTYTVTLTVTDNLSATGSTSKSITVTASPPPPSPISLSTRGYRTKGIPKVDLTWSGATTANVDVYRNGVIIVTTPNDGLHTDTLAKTSVGTFTYKVCEAARTVCSANSSVIF